MSHTNHAISIHTDYDTVSGGNFPLSLSSASEFAVGDAFSGGCQDWVINIYQSPGETFLPWGGDWWLTCHDLLLAHCTTQSAIINNMQSGRVLFKAQLSWAAIMCWRAVNTQRPASLMCRHLHVNYVTRCVSHEIECGLTEPLMSLNNNNNNNTIYLIMTSMKNEIL